MSTAKRARLLTATMIALLGALPVLAYLQYRWIGEAGRAEIERTKAGFRRGAEQLAEEFNTEIGRLHNIVLTATDPEDQNRQRYAERVKDWLALTEHPTILQALYLTEGGDDGLDRLFQLDHEHRRFEEAQWPAPLEPLRADLQMRRRGGPRMGRNGPPGSGLTLPALVAPHSPPRQYRLEEPPPLDPPRPPERLGPRPHRISFVIAVLDLETIRRWLPALVRKYIATEGQPECDVRIVWRESGEAIYDSTPDLPRDAFTRPDAETGMFPSRPNPPAGMMRRPEGPQGRPDPGRWRIMVERRNGSVEAAVARSQTRDLAVSAGVLLIMAAGVVTLTLSMRRADQLAKQQMQFVAAVSHELRTPLAVIKSAADNLADGVVTSPDSMKQYGVLIRDAGQRLSYLVEQTLRFAGIQTGRARYNLVPTDVAAVIADAVKSCDGILQTSGCKLESEVERNLPAVLADAGSLSVCVGNLLTNAAKHAGSGGWIGIRATNGAGGVRIEVRDHGPGIDSRDLPHIFEAFYRGRAAESQQVRGTGLGLALVRQIITAHNGEIAVDSRVGEGSRFTLSLPAAPNAHPS